MTLPRALVVHALPGRTRIRLPTKKGDGPYFASLEPELARLPGVATVRVNPTTGSVLVWHDGELADLGRYASEKGLFQVVPSAPGADGTLCGIYEELGALDARLKERTKGAMGVSSASFYLLVGASLVQLAKGRFMPPGGTLLIEAFKVLVVGAQAEAREARREA